MMLNFNGEAGTISYHTVIKACAEARDGEAGTISYHTVIKACAEARDVATVHH